MTLLVNNFVNQYYVSYLSLVFESAKIVVILVYLLIKMGAVVWVGFGLGVALAQGTMFLSRMIQKCDFERFACL